MNISPNPLPYDPWEFHISTVPDTAEAYRINVWPYYQASAYLDRSNISMLTDHITGSGGKGGGFEAIFFAPRALLRSEVGVRVTFHPTARPSGRAKAAGSVRERPWLIGCQER